MKRNRGKTGVMLVWVWLAVIAVVVPVGLLLCWSFANRWPWPYILPQAWTLRGWERLFGGYVKIGRVACSSAALSLVVALLSGAIATMTARALCLYAFPGRRVIAFFALLPAVVPATAFGMGSHLLVIRLGINNTLAAVAISHLICALPFAVKIMTGITKTVSSRLEEQARVSGATALRAFWHGTLPSIAPGVLSAMAVSFLFSYTQYFLTLLMGGGKVKTMAVVVMPLIEGADKTISSAYSVLFMLSAMGMLLVFQLATTRLTQRIGGNLGG